MTNEDKLRNVDDGFNDVVLTEEDARFIENLPSLLEQNLALTAELAAVKRERDGLREAAQRVVAWFFDGEPGDPGPDTYDAMLALRAALAPTEPTSPEAADAAGQAPSRDARPEIAGGY